MNKFQGVFRGPLQNYLTPVNRVCVGSTCKTMANVFKVNMKQGTEFYKNVYKHFVTIKRALVLLSLMDILKTSLINQLNNVNTSRKLFHLEDKLLQIIYTLYKPYKIENVNSVKKNLTNG